MATANAPEASAFRLFDGHLDGVENDGWLAGWASTDTPGVLARLAVHVDGKIVGEIVADQYREDLATSSLPNTSCAFWYSLPDEFRDGLPHRIEMRLAATNEELRGSPQEFQQYDVRAGHVSDDRNIVPNAELAAWPGGLSVPIETKFQEFAAGWYFDFRKGNLPAVRLSATSASDLALEPGHYALHMRVTDSAQTYLRMVVPLGSDLDDLKARRFSITIRRPPHALPDALHVEEIFVGAVNKGAVRRLYGLRKKLMPRGTQRILNIPAPQIDDAVTLAEGEQAALILQFKGEGEMTLCAPQLRKATIAPAEGSEAAGEFEDANIQAQVGKLKLSPIWGSRRLTVLPTPGEPPVPALSRGVQHGQSGVPFIQIVIPVFNAAAHVEEAIQSIIAHTTSPFEILLFDDGSEPYTEARMSRWEAMDPRIRFHAHGANIGYTRNINVALQSAVSDYIVLLNSDTIVTPRWLTKLYEGMLQSSDTAAVGPLSNAASWQSVPRTKAADGEWSLNEYPGELTPESIATLIEGLSEAIYPEFPLLNGFCTLFRRAALEDIGYYDDALFPQGYGEENDLCLRLGAAGYKLRVADNAFVFHKKSKSFGGERRKVLSKQASLSLRAKHPETNIAEIEEMMRTSAPINLLRQRLVSAMQIELT